VDFSFLLKRKRMRKRGPVNYKENFKIYLGLLGRYKALAIVSLVIVVIMQLASVSEKFLFKSFIDKGSEFLNNTIGKSEFVNHLWILALVFLGLVVVRSISNSVRVYLLNRLDARLMRDLKQKFFAHLINLDYKFHSEKKTGSLISQIMRGSRAVENITDVLVFNMVPLIMRLVMVGAALIYFDLYSGISLFVTTILFVVYSIVLQFRQESAHVRYNKIDDREKANISDVFSNVETVKYFGKEKRIISRFKRLSEKTYRAALRFWDYFIYLSGGQQFILGVGTFFVLYFPVRALINGSLSVGTLAFIYTSYLSVTGFLFSFVHGIRSFRMAIIDFNELFKYEKIEKEVKDVPGAKPIKIKRGEIEFIDVSFFYKNEGLIKNLNLRIKPKTKVAIVGPSGAGKSTIVKLLFRLFDVKKGKILIDGIDIRKVKQESLRSEMSIVPQDAILFDDTIYNNIAFANPKASRKEVFKAIRFAQLDKLIERLPKKENTIVGERGVKLSGGERQRVSIARAVLANKKILVLDEATSSLDSETEREIQKDLEELMKNKTTIIIAHRLGTVMKADIIIVVDKGRITEIGTHKELISKKSGLYKKLWELQIGGYLEKG
jgi:ATP-binding cassette subfamily B protein